MFEIDNLQQNKSLVINVLLNTLRNILEYLNLFADLRGKFVDCEGKSWTNSKYWESLLDCNSVSFR